MLLSRDAGRITEISNAASNVIVTGAGGFIGGHVVQHLRSKAGFSVTAATRDASQGSRELDLRNTASVRAAVQGMDAVVHCAVGDRAVTVGGTATLLREAAAAGVRRVVHLSSMSVYGDATGRVTEDTPMVPSDRDDYAGWKAAAEQACLAQSGIDTVRLRPTIVYGPGSRQWISWYAERIRSGRWGTFGAEGEGTCNLVHVRDVAGAVAAALTAEHAAGRAFNVNGPEHPTWNAWFTRLAQAIGAPPLPVLTPATMKQRALIGLPLKVLGKLGIKRAQAALIGTPGRGELSLFGRKATYPIEAAETVLGWTPIVSVAEGLADSVAWLRTYPS